LIVVLTVGALALAVVLGLAIKRFTSSDASADDKNAADVPRVLGSTALLAGLLIAIVLSGASSSYSAARSAAKAEADTIDTMYESAEYVAQPFRQRLQGAAVCYARAVAGPEWDSMSKGEGSSVPSAWTGTSPGGIRRTLIKMTPSAVGFGGIQSTDATRGNQRSERLTQAKPSVPNILFAFMIFLLALSLAGLAYSIPARNNLPHKLALGTVTVLFAIVMLMIANFDRPFSGPLALDQSAMQSTERDDSADYLSSYGVKPPCDSDGHPSAYLVKLSKKS
jgi:Protein of unknown function (DUF4239)